MKRINRTIVSALIFSKDGKLLMGRKDPRRGGVYLDCWHIPGGGVDENENQLDTLKREVLEETGIDITGYESSLVDDEGRGRAQMISGETGEKNLQVMSFFVYRVDISDKNAHEIATSTDDDLSEIQWFSLDELASVKLTPPSVRLFKRLGYI